MKKKSQTDWPKREKLHLPAASQFSKNAGSFFLHGINPIEILLPIANLLEASLCSYKNAMIKQIASRELPCLTGRNKDHDYFFLQCKIKIDNETFLLLFIHCVMSKKYFRNKPDLFRHRQFDKLVNIHVNQTPAAIYAWDEKFDWVLLCFSFEKNLCWTKN